MEDTLSLVSEDYEFVNFMSSTVLDEGIVRLAIPLKVSIAENLC